jgi:glycosyltransferase involved in cell wall biosynthesis
MFKPQISVVVTRYNEPDAIVAQCLEALAKQVLVSAKVYFLDQEGSHLIETLCEKFSSKKIHFEYEIIPAKSLSYARTYGIKKSMTQYVAFCDADALPFENWLAELCNTFAETDADIVGTKILPLWEKNPRWYHKSRFVREFYSTMDLYNHRNPIPKIIGASFAISLKRYKDEMYFDQYLGRTKGILLGGEETDLCTRVVKRGGLIIYTPFTYVDHMIARERMKLPWILKRAYFGGFSRFMRGGKVETFNKKPSLVDYLAMALIVPSYLLGYLMAAVKLR